MSQEPEGFVDPTRDDFRAFAAFPRPGLVHMLNLVRLKPVATYPDGSQTTGLEAYKAYADNSAQVFMRVGGRIVWRGRFEQTLIGPPGETWDICFIAAYPSTAAFVAMVKDPVYREAVKHRQAAVADSRLIRIEPQCFGVAFLRSAPSA